MRRNGKLLLCFVLLVFSVFGRIDVRAQIFNEEAVKFGQALNWVDKYYVDSVNKSRLVEEAIIGMLKELDPHSTYLTREEVRKMSEPLQGNFEGIGISFNILRDTIFVINPIPGGPSERVGIVSGDRIVKIEGKNVAGTGITNADVISELRGEKGTRVNVTVARRGIKDLLEFTIIRDKIPIYSLDASYMITPKIAYIKLNRFAFTSPDEFNKAYQELREKKVDDLILDLSGNGGGYLDVAVKLADQFLDDRKLIVYTEGVHHEKREYFASGEGVFHQGRVIVIIDEGSASASEIVAGAIQDWDRGLIVGRRSFGKGLVQRPLKLNDGSMIRLTIARYHTPTGRIIQKPYEKGYTDYSRDLIKRIKNGELNSSDSIVFPDSLHYRTLKNQRSVYGGGGIMPDYFVPLDTSYYSGYYRKLLNRGILNFFVLDYIDRNRNELMNEYSDFKSFKEGTFPGDALMKELVEFAGEKGLEMDRKGYERSEEHIGLVMKAYVARDLWNTSEFYEIMNSANPAVNKAVELLNNESAYHALIVN